MPKVQVDLPDDVHGAVRVEAARRQLTIAAAVAVLCREAVMGPLVGGAPPVVGVVLEDRPVVERRRPAGEAPWPASEPVPVEEPLTAVPWPEVPARGLAEEAAALAATKRDRPVTSFPKPGRPEKKGRGRS